MRVIKMPWYISFLLQKVTYMQIYVTYYRNINHLNISRFDTTDIRPKNRSSRRMNRRYNPPVAGHQQAMYRM